MFLLEIIELLQDAPIKGSHSWDKPEVWDWAHGPRTHLDTDPGVLPAPTPAAARQRLAALNLNFLALGTFKLKW